MLLNRYIRKRMRLVNTVVLRYNPLTVRCNICTHTWEPKPDPGDDKLKNLWYMCPKGCGDKILEDYLDRQKKKKGYPAYSKHW
jgi:hypothetical protein